MLFCVFTGKRICPGKQLSNIEQIIFLVKLLQTFIFENVPGQKLNTDIIFSLTRCPTEFKFKAIRRK